MSNLNQVDMSVSEFVHIKFDVFSSFSSPTIPKDFIRLPFPPTINPKDLIAKQSNDGIKSRVPRSPPNAFIIYRKLFIENARSQGYRLPMTVMSPMVSHSWKKEPSEVKEEYMRIAREANRYQREMYQKTKREERWNKFFSSGDVNESNRFKNSNANTRHSSKFLLDKKIQSCNLSYDNYQKIIGPKYIKEEIEYPFSFNLEYPSGEKFIMMNDKDWLEAQIEANNIKYFNYAEFSEIRKVGEGGFGCVSKAYWKSRRMTVALKTLKIDSIREFVRELKLLRNVFYHQRINKFLGITRDVRSNYVMVLQYANGGNLRDYLRHPPSPLTWPDKYRIALEIAEGLLCLHAEGILHRDLHPKNILVHQGKMLIADFGLSKEESLTSSDSIVNGMPAYIDPQCHIQDEYKRNKKSDIFSLGTILWEISSEKVPFAEYKDSQVVWKISNGIREKRIDGTPESYFKLYTECWDNVPEKRPNIEKVVEILEDLSQIK